MRRPSHRGFTLAEMMTVVAIMAITTALAVGSIDRLRTHTAAREGAEAVQQAMIAARQRAHALGRCTRLELLDASGTTVGSGVAGVTLLLRTWSSAHCELGATDALDPGGEIRRLPMGVTARRDAPADPATADWLPSGRTRAGGTTQFTVASPDTSLAVVGVPQGPVCILRGGDTCP